MSNYIFDNAGQQAGQRFTSLETLYDSWTIRHLEATGIDTGWQCWEIGGGGGSLATWPWQRSGPTRHVLLIALKPRLILQLANLFPPTDVMQRPDIDTQPLPAQTF